MKKLFLSSFVSCFLLPFVSWAQSVGVNTATPHASAILDVKSTNKGMLIPRTSSASRTAIASPAKGLILYDTTTSSFWYHNGSSWAEISSGSGNGWNLTGNAGTNPASNFIGTTDYQPLLFKVNNMKGGELNAFTYNTSFGVDAALAANSGGIANTAMGYNALFNNTTGDYNTAVGVSSLASNSTTSNNTAIGVQAMISNFAGYGNTAAGAYALQGNTSGTHNVAAGDSAAYSTTTGINNVAVGAMAGWKNSVGANNTFIGHAAGENITTGYANTFLGSAASATSSDYHYATAIGFYAYAGCSNCLALGGTSFAATRVGINNPTPLTDLHIIQQTDAGGDKVRGLRLQRSSNTNHWRIMIDPSNNLIFEYNDAGYSYINPTTLAFVQGSDERLKKDVVPLNTVLDKIMQLQAKTYHYKANNENDPRSYGFLAQDVQRLFPDFVSENKADGMLGIAYGNFGVVAIKAIQEQQKEIEALKKQNEIQQSQYAELKKEIESLKTKK